MTGRWLAVFLTSGLLGTPSPARGDVVHLASGEVIEGRVIERGDVVEVELTFGMVRLPRAEVVSIERGPTRAERLQQVLSATDLDDPTALEVAAAEAERLGFPERAAELRSMALDRELERRLAATAPDDAGGFVALAAWARTRGASEETQRYLLRRALRADPDSRAAREAVAALEKEQAAVGRRQEAQASRGPPRPSPLAAGGGVPHAAPLPSGYYYDTRVRVWWWYHPQRGWWSHDGHAWSHHPGHTWGHHGDELHYFAPHHFDDSVRHAPHHAVPRHGSGQHGGVLHDGGHHDGGHHGSGQHDGLHDGGGHGGGGHGGGGHGGGGHGGGGHGGGGHSGGGHGGGGH